MGIVDRHERQASLLRALSSFAADSGVTIIAEGIEDPAEAAVCRNAGAGLGQGYLVARPGPPLPEPTWRPSGHVPRRDATVGSEPV